jgi:hypothetical protein
MVKDDMLHAHTSLRFQLDEQMYLLENVKMERNAQPPESEMLYSDKRDEAVTDTASMITTTSKAVFSTPKNR